MVEQDSEKASCSWRDKYVKFDMRLYQSFDVPKESPYYALIHLEPSLKTLVTFSPNRHLPTHRWFDYKQGFSTSLVENLVNRLGVPEKGLVLDPFCGVGTTILTCKSIGLESVGFDVLPLAVFVTNVKLQNGYNLDILNQEAKKLANVPLHEAKSEWPSARIIPRAFSPDVSKALLAYKDHILSIEDDRTRNLFLLALLSIVEDASFTRKDGGFLRIDPTKKPQSPKVLLKEAVSWMMADIETSQGQLTQEQPKFGRAVTKEGDARDLSLDSDSVSLTITSPPYLNKTDYTRLYSLELYLGGFCKDFEDLRRLRYRTFRSHVEAKPFPGQATSLHSEILQRQITDLRPRKLNNPRTIYMIEGYFEDSAQFLRELYRVTQKGGKAAIVVWNSRFAGVNFDVDTILAELSEQIGFRVEEIIVARQKGISAQQVAAYGETPLRESILVIEK